MTDSAWCKQRGSMTASGGLRTRKVSSEGLFWLTGAWPFGNILLRAETEKLRVVPFLSVYF
jgi:hypothetical protein